MELKWPVNECENCHKDLSKIIPTAEEKGLDENHNPIWTCHCSCGRGYPVGVRVEISPRNIGLINNNALTVEGMRARTNANIKKDDFVEDEISTAIEDDSAKEIASLPDIIPDGMFWCTKDKTLHRASSHLGKIHKKYALIKEVKEAENASASR